MLSPSIPKNGSALTVGGLRHGITGIRLLLPLATTLALSLYPCSAEERSSVGVQLALLSEVAAVAPGESFRVGLLIRHDEGFHTYWQNPGIVGIATQLDWALPEGFAAGPIQWPYPEKVDMAGHPAHGFHRDVLLTVTITPPATIEEKEVTLQASALWMACARTCHPGQQNLLITLPVGKKTMANPTHQAAFAKADTELPQALAGWQVEALSAADEAIIRLSLTPPKSWLGSPESLHLFSTDNQVSSDQPQVIAVGKEGTLVMTLQRSEFSPKGLDTLEGFLFTSETSGIIATRYRR